MNIPIGMFLVGPMIEAMMGQMAALRAAQAAQAQAQAAAWDATTPLRATVVRVEHLDDPPQLTHHVEPPRN
jgi:membrane protease subunit (stomatin/prohibitin family)